MSGDYAEGGERRKLWMRRSHEHDGRRNELRTRRGKPERRRTRDATFSLNRRFQKLLGSSGHHCERIVLYKQTISSDWISSLRYWHGRPLASRTTKQACWFSLTFLVNDYSRPFASAAAFGNKFADWCSAAGLKPVLCDDGRVRSFRGHGLRKAALTRAAHAGCTGPELMA